MDDLVSHLALFLLSNVLFGGVMAAFLLRHVERTILGGGATVLLGLGLAPFMITWVLNAILLLSPGGTPVVAVGGVLVFFSSLALFAGRGWRSLAEVMTGSVSLWRSAATWPYLFFSMAMIFGSYVMLVYKPLVDHDILEYGTQGRIFLREMAVRYELHHYDQASGFYYVGLHGFSFPLLFTWEGAVRGLLNSDGDAWVRLQTPFFAWLLVTFVWGWARRYGTWLAVWVIGAFTLTIGFLYLNTIYHVDPVRVFLFTASMALFASVLRAPSSAGLLLWGLVLGAHALTHSLGMILAPFMLLILVALSPGTITARLRQGGLATMAFVVAGGFHYILDVTIGTGWLFKDITWF
ncbi:MAG TPA: hypothetical protein PLR96_02570 [Flavobacteriales bacterium]|nr:hypothetical protein [Flavobacteriales bacterium]